MHTLYAIYFHVFTKVTEDILKKIKKHTSIDPDTYWCINNNEIVLIYTQPRFVYLQSVSERLTRSAMELSQQNIESEIKLNSKPLTLNHKTEPYAFKINQPVLYEGEAYYVRDYVNAPMSNLNGYVNIYNNKKPHNIIMHFISPDKLTPLFYKITIVPKVLDINYNYKIDVHYFPTVKELLTKLDGFFNYFSNFTIYTTPEEMK